MALSSATLESLVVMAMVMAPTGPSALITLHHAQNESGRDESAEYKSFEYRVYGEH